MLALGELKEELLGLSETILNRLYRLFREVLVLDNKLMEVVSEEVSTDVAAMTIIDAEEGALRPFCPRELLRLRFHNVQDDRYSIFIVVTNDTLIRIGTISCHNTVAFGGELG